MKSIVLSGILLTATAAGAHAQCNPRFASGGEMVGRQAWLAHNDASHLPYHVSDYKGLRVPSLKQVGPTAWEPDETYLPHGVQVTVKRVVANFPDSPLARYLEVELDGKSAVVETNSVIPYDFRQCPASVVLADSGVTDHTVQWMDSLSMKLRPGARPTHFDGKWVDEQWLEKIAYLDCSQYEFTSLNPKSTMCSVVWQDGFEPPQYDENVPRDIFVTDDMVEQVVGG